MSDDKKSIDNSDFVNKKTEITPETSAFAQALSKVQKKETAKQTTENAETSKESTDADTVTVAATTEAATTNENVKLPVRDKFNRSYGTGRRKNAVARVWVKPGSGKIIVNGKSMEEYFPRPVLQMVIRQPLLTANRETEIDVNCTVRGGGLSGQAGAVRHGMSHALIAFEPDLRPPLKSEGFLTRDARMVERKKYGRAKARRRFQFSKR